MRIRSTLPGEIGQRARGSWRASPGRRPRPRRPVRGRGRGWRWRDSPSVAPARPRARRGQAGRLDQGGADPAHGIDDELAGLAVGADRRRASSGSILPGCRVDRSGSGRPLVLAWSWRRARRPAGPDSSRTDRGSRSGGGGGGWQGGPRALHGCAEIVLLYRQPAIGHPGMETTASSPVRAGRSCARSRPRSERCAAGGLRPRAQAEAGRQYRPPEPWFPLTVGSLA